MSPLVPVYMPDLSELLHGTQKEAFRNYENDENPIALRVQRTYREMHTKQTVNFVLSQHEKWLKFNHAELTVMEALDALNNIVDESDPDTDLPNIVHAFQTAERIRERHPDKPWFQLTGLIHDLGKIMAFYEEPHWAVCGDTFPVGCLPDKRIVYGSESFEGNVDLDNPLYASLNGMYSAHCGIDQLLMSWGHDEYLYRVLVNHGCTLPKQALNIIRYHSFYPWHEAGAYGHLMNDTDNETLSWVKEFNQFDLYSKSDHVPEVESLKSYYQGLIDVYCPGKIRF
ncbi:inositol oxygenase-like [Convolutriloba macropyga]|uniref:inositol oxygenase-like n=1 Tax=Convolutriloba macropyga TaxID=536237 RepID=UPI003F52906F